MKETIYKIIDIFTFRRGLEISLSGLKFRLPIRYARYYEDGYEKDNFDYYRKMIQPSDNVIDIGGHIGLNTVYFAKLAYLGHVYVFEPAPNTLKVIKETIRINNLKNVTIIPSVVSDKNEIIQFYINDSDIADNANSIINHRKDKNLKSVNIESTTLDEFIEKNKIEKIDFVKIDAEGGELRVLKGGKNMLTKFKPKMTLGLHPHPIVVNGDSLEEIYNILESHNYRIEHNHVVLTKEKFCSKTDLFDVQLQ